MAQPPLAQAPGEDADRRMFQALRTAAAASLAGGIIAASGKPHTPDEAVVLLEEVREAMRPGRARPSPADAA